MCWWFDLLFMYTDQEPEVNKLEGDIRAGYGEIIVTSPELCSLWDCSENELDQFMMGLRRSGMVELYYKLPVESYEENQKPIDEKRERVWRDSMFNIVKVVNIEDWVEFEDTDS